MNIDLIISADDIKEDKIKDKSVVVIDMLRATSVIITAVNNGCTKVVPVLTIEEAVEMAREHRENFILGGERKALKIEGFDCSNSPLEFKKEIVLGKTVIMTTTNGTRAIKGSNVAKNILIGALINAKAIAEKTIQLDNDVVFVNAGTYGEFSIDDFICSGYIIDCILKKKKAILSDIAFTSHYIYRENKDIIGYIKNAKHYKRITELGLQDDLNYCCQKDILDLVPEYDKNLKYIV